MFHFVYFILALVWFFFFLGGGGGEGEGRGAAVVFFPSSFLFLFVCSIFCIFRYLQDVQLCKQMHRQRYTNMLLGR